MWIKNSVGNFINLESICSVKLSEPNNINQSQVVAYFNTPTANDPMKGETILYQGSLESCQAYMTELEKELAAFGKLARVEVD